MINRVIEAREVDHKTTSLHPRILPAFHLSTELPAMRDMNGPRIARRLHRWITLLFIATPFILLFIPWQQTVVGRGRVIAYNPTERQAVLTSRINGQIKKWHVREGSEVKKGQPIVDIEDNDPAYAANLDMQREQIRSQIAAAKKELTEQENVIAQSEKSLDASVSAAREVVKASKEVVTANEKALDGAMAQLKFDSEQFKRFKELFEETGARSELDYLRSKASFERAQAEVLRLETLVMQAKATVSQNESLVLQRQADGSSSLATARRQANDVIQKLHTHERSLQQIENTIERYSARFVVAPYDCVVLRVEANVGQGGAYVKEGEALVTIVPKTSDLVVELWIEGVDAPLIQKDENGEYPHVRLQFEGWPALQFSGWPSAARGTFGGKVRQIDATDNGKGQFRIFVEPDTMFDEDEWPDKSYLRQGNQAIGWVFLNRVTLGWELWRRLNGFPPVLAPQEPGKDSKKK